MKCFSTRSERNLDNYRSISTKFNLKFYNALNLKVNSIPLAVVFFPPTNNSHDRTGPCWNLQ